MQQDSESEVSEHRKRQRNFTLVLKLDNVVAECAVERNGRRAPLFRAIAVSANPGIAILRMLVNGISPP